MKGKSHSFLTACQVSRTKSGTAEMISDRETNLEQSWKVELFATK